MKKRYAAVIAFAVLLLFLPFAFADAVNIWVECRSSCPDGENKCLGSGNICCKPNEKESTTNKYCCYTTDYNWQETPNTPCCIDNDNDDYGNPASPGCKNPT